MHLSLVRLDEVGGKPEATHKNRARREPGDVAQHGLNRVDTEVVRNASGGHHGRPRAIESGSDDLLDPGLSLKVDGHEGQRFRRFYPELIEPAADRR